MDTLAVPGLYDAFIRFIGHPCNLYRYQGIFQKMKYKKAFHKFIFTLSVTTAVMIALAMLIYSLTPPYYYTPAFPFLLLFFYIINFLMYRFLLKEMEKRPEKFINAFMAVTTTKLVLYMSVMIVYALVFKEDAKQFITVFFILYVVYTSIEVVSLLRVNGKKPGWRSKAKKTEET
jgi:ABC-type Fe3+-siderophore transport system permease subunit